MKFVYPLCFVLVSSVFLIGCGGNDNTDIADGIKKEAKKNRNVDLDNEEEVRTYTKDQLRELKTASKVVYTLPSPNEMATILHETKAVYDIKILNPVANLDQYVADLSKALNLGVYFADLSFTSMFDYPQQAMMFMGAAQALTEELNIDGVFTEDMMVRIEENTGDKDSLMQIVADAYVETDVVLQEDERPIVAKAILAGAWIEGLFIAVNLQTAKGKELEVRNKIGAQKPSLDNLIEMLKDIEEPQLSALIKQLMQLQLAFEPVESVEVKDESEAGNLANMQKIVMSDQTFEMIKKITIQTRNKVVNSQL
jgi:hypothetical protein